jgi:3-(3-hydroxy-phenyl)propionate hydroxylase
LGRFAIAGDAAHVNNPLGAMGLNGAVHDAVNLGGKIAGAWHGEGGPELLDRYTRQRRPPQLEFVQRITIANKRLVEERDPKVRRERQDELRRLAADRQRCYEYLIESSMIAMVRKAATIG